MILRTPSSPTWMKAFMLLSICTLITFSSGAQGRRGRGRIFTTVDQAATFPGGDSGFTAYLSKSIRYPQEARSMKIQGKVFLTFVVERDGSLSQVKVKRGIGSGCDEEAVRVIKASPKWVPAKQKGQIVRQQYTVPIKFSISRV